MNPQKELLWGLWVKELLWGLWVKPSIRKPKPFPSNLKALDPRTPKPFTSNLKALDPKPNLPKPFKSPSDILFELTGAESS